MPKQDRAHAAPDEGKNDVPFAHQGNKKAGNQPKKRNSVAGDPQESGSQQTPQQCSLLDHEFHDYACAKAFDILSKGMYKKFLSQSRNAGEEWACNVVHSVVSVQRVVACIHDLIRDMPSWVVAEGAVASQQPPAVCIASLAEACIEVMDAATPPRCVLYI